MPEADSVAHTLDVPGARLYYERRGALADRLGASVIEFPGDHGGFMTQPEQFARVLDQVLTLTS